MQISKPSPPLRRSISLLILLKSLRSNVATVCFLFFPSFSLLLIAPARRSLRDPFCHSVTTAMSNQLPPSSHPIPPTTHILTLIPTRTPTHTHTSIRKRLMCLLTELPTPSPRIHHSLPRLNRPLQGCQNRNQETYDPMRSLVTVKHSQLLSHPSLFRILPLKKLPEGNNQPLSSRPRRMTRQPRKQSQHLLSALLPTHLYQQPRRSALRR